ncbi:MAG: hypothetical protein RL291_1248 [Pseudomonadota bacterium]
MLKTSRTLPCLSLLAALGASNSAHAQTFPLGTDAKAKCAELAQLKIEPSKIGLPSGAGAIDSAVLVEASPVAIQERGPTPAARVTPAQPQHCRVIGRLAPVSKDAPPIRFQVNLPAQWNGRSVQYGGGGFNGVLITGLALPPAMPWDRPSPLAQGYVTYGTDSGHENKPNEPVQTFALNDEALVNFAHASYKKVRDAATVIMREAYGRPPQRRYFMGSSEGGREGVMMAQRYPNDFDGIFARVPVLNWTGLQFAGTRNGIATMGEGWLTPAHVTLVANATRERCDVADGAKDNLIANAPGCLKTFDPAALVCKPGQAPDTCLNDKQVTAIKTLRSTYRFPFALAHGVREYPGFGISGEDIPASGPTGGWNAWWLGTRAPQNPPVQGNSIAWTYGAGAVSYFYLRDPKADVTSFKIEEHKKRILEVSAMMDATNPDLERFRARGGKIIILEYMADYAQSPFAGIRYFESVENRMGRERVRDFARLYVAPGVDHVGSGAPGNVDMLAVLADWVERGKPPGKLEVKEQKLEAGFPTQRALPLCRWPTWPKYNGSGDVTKAENYRCSR